MVPKIRVDLFYDVISPYSWIGFEGFQRYKTVWPIDLHLKPFYFASIAKKNLTAPLRNELKFNHMCKDIQRANRYWGIDIGIPEGFVSKALTNTTIHAQRSLVAIHEKFPELEVPTARALWSKLFSEGKEIFSEADVREILQSLNVKNIDEIISLSKSQPIKDKLKKNTEEAEEQGCFGAPWMHVHTKEGIEPFFGSDRFELIGHLIGHPFQGPLKP